MNQRQYENYILNSSNYSEEITLQEILDDSSYCALFKVNIFIFIKNLSYFLKIFLDEEHTTENLLFWLEVGKKKNIIRISF